MKFHTMLLLGSFLSIITVTNSALALDCRNPQSQTAMNQCASVELEYETKKINKTYNDYRANLDPAHRQQLKEVQLAWIKFKDLACEFDASGSEGGSVHSMVLANCLTEKTRQRNKELETLANCQEGDVSC